MIFINHIIVKTRKILLKSLKICHYCWSIINAIGTRLGQVKSLGLLVAFVFLSFCHKFVYLYFPSTPLRCGLVIFAIGYCILLLFFVQINATTIPAQVMIDAGKVSANNSMINIMVII